jgi:hypothetical protein
VGSGRNTAAYAASRAERDSTEALLRQLISSAAWVIGIPAGITLLIVIAIWLTENVWMPTDQIVLHLIK